MEPLPHFAREERPWGGFERFTLNEKTTVKLVTVNPGEAISLQTHEHRDEFWRVVAGAGMVTIAGQTQDARVGESFFSPRGAQHRVEAGPEGLSFLEIAFGDFDERDITRLEDKYGRA